LPTSEEFEKQKEKTKMGKLNQKIHQGWRGTTRWRVTDEPVFLHQQAAPSFFYIYVLIWEFLFSFIFTLWGCTVAGICFVLFSTQRGGNQVEKR
jgi:hypothetical protein